MAERILKLNGKVNWVKVQEDNLDNADGRFPGPPKASLDFYPDEASLILLTTSGSRVEVKENEEGKYVKLKRNKTRSYTDKKTKQVIEEDMGLPYVSMGVNEDGTIIPFHGLVGNGSTATVKVTVYDTKAYGKGTRLEALNIEDLVEYTPSAKERVAEDLYKF